jgi:hypothetical protein
MKKKTDKKEEPKKEGKPNKILIMKILNEIDRYYPFLTGEELLTFSKVSKQFSKTFLPILKKYNNEKIANEEKELEEIKKEEKKISEFKLGKAVLKAIESLNDKNNLEYLKNYETPNEYVILLYRIAFQLINKEKDILKIKDNNEFWKLCKENIIKNSEEKGIGEFLKNEFSNLDFSPVNINTIYSLCEGKEEKLMPLKKEGVDGLIFFLVRYTLEYIGINIGNAKNKKVRANDTFQKYLEFSINKRKENSNKLDKIISKLN